eukprot:8876939-Pyramimonas_sp.AAC.1
MWHARQRGLLRWTPWAVFRCIQSVCSLKWATVRYNCPPPSVARPFYPITRRLSSRSDSAREVGQPGDIFHHCWHPSLPPRTQGDRILEHFVECGLRSLPSATITE